MEHGQGENFPVMILAMRHGPVTPLTRRETELLRLIEIGLTSKEIAALLGISPKTVRCHRWNLLGKLKARNAIELVRRGQELGCLETPMARARRGLGGSLLVRDIIAGQDG